MARTLAARAATESRRAQLFAAGFGQSRTNPRESLDFCRPQSDAGKLGSRSAMYSFLPGAPRRIQAIPPGPRPGAEPRRS
eukprot:3231190-Pyramimonas_sp.AAC.1